MIRRIDGLARSKYTLEFKLEAVRLVKGGQAAAVTATMLGMPNQTLDNWVSATGPRPGSSSVNSVDHIRLLAPTFAR